MIFLFVVSCSNNKAGLSGVSAEDEARISIEEEHPIDDSGVLDGNEVAAADDILTIDVDDEGSSPPILVTGSALASCTFMTESTVICSFKDDTIPADFDFSSVVVTDKDGLEVDKTQLSLKIVSSDSGPKLEVLYIPELKNHPPVLTEISSFPGVENTYMGIIYETFQLNASASDLDGDELNYEFVELLSGTLTTDGATVVEIGEHLAPGSQWVWIPDSDVTGNDIPAFSVKAWDGFARSAVAVVSFNVKARARINSISSSNPNGHYIAGDTITLQLTFSESVNVTGTPTLDLKLDGGNKAINYSSGSGTKIGRAHV